MQKWTGDLINFLVYTVKFQLILPTPVHNYEYLQLWKNEWKAPPKRCPQCLEQAKNNVINGFSKLNKLQNCFLSSLSYRSFRLNNMDFFCST